jgi:hypothetical protein
MSVVTLGRMENETGRVGPCLIRRIFASAPARP